MNFFKKNYLSLVGKNNCKFWVCEEVGHCAKQMRKYDEEQAYRNFG